MIKELIFTILPEATLETELIGKNSIFDSIGLVNFIVDLEVSLAQKGINIIIASDKAISLSNSPFRTVQTLIDFINDDINNRDK